VIESEFAVNEIVMPRSVEVDGAACASERRSTGGDNGGGGRWSTGWDGRGGRRWCEGMAALGVS